jgi:tRNA-Thr(GGU) m(6)t(6)A37 methyltransferase TsaA
MKIEFSPIGIIHSPYNEPRGTPIQGAFAKNVIGTAEIYPEYLKGLNDLDGFSHIILLYSFHMSSGYNLLCRPFLDTVERGLFATRAPRRPNPIGFSTVKLLKIEDNILTIESLDMIDGTPLLDIKPYIDDFDIRNHVRTGWYKDAQNRAQTVADDRFDINKHKTKGDNTNG